MSCCSELADDQKLKNKITVFSWLSLVSPFLDSGFELCDHLTKEKALQFFLGWGVFFRMYVRLIAYKYYKYNKYYNWKKYYIDSVLSINV